MRLPEGFTVNTKPLQLSDELEALYQVYRSQLDFEVSPTLRDNLFSLCFISSEEEPVFDSRVIEIRDQGKLIAAGIYDTGEESISGIINIYDPAYKKYSPGKQLILFKLKDALEQGITYFYPGYIVVGFPKFDYKLEPGEGICEIYDTVKGGWIPYSIAGIMNAEAPPMD